MKSLIGRSAALLDRLFTLTHPAKVAAFGYLLYIVAGWLLLSLPFAQRGGTATALDHLFIATSAVSTTGLATISVADSYTWFGQLVILLLIQLGGIGYMTFGSFVALSIRPQLSDSREKIGRTVFALPASFRMDKFIRSVVGFTVVIEVVGAAVLYPALVNAGAADPLWSAIFHSVSAFCTAGFSLYNDSFMSMAGNFWINAILGALAYLGGIGFIVCIDFWRMLRGKSDRITLTSKIILLTSFWIMVAGTLFLFLGEGTLATLPPERRWLAALFQTMTAMTTVGFNTVDIGQFSNASLLLVVILMVIGASPSGTGGGVKSTTLSALYGVMRSSLRGERVVRFWGNPIPDERVWSAMAAFSFYMATLVAGTWLLELT
ncbi:MAG: potassium transporter KtrB, partial [Nitrospinae bacterium]|nr:potassium transporter KtrB [Nitrospinota bacterium]